MLNINYLVDRFFFHHFKYVIPLLSVLTVSDEKSSLYEMRNSSLMIKFLFIFSLDAFKIFSLYNLITMCLSVDLLEFILLEAH